MKNIAKNRFKQAVPEDAILFKLEPVNLHIYIAPKSKEIDLPLLDVINNPGMLYPEPEPAKKLTALVVDVIRSNPTILFDPINDAVDMNGVWMTNAVKTHGVGNELRTLASKKKLKKDDTLHVTHKVINVDGGGSWRTYAGIDLVCRHPGIVEISNPDHTYSIFLAYSLPYKYAHKSNMNHRMTVLITALEYLLSKPNAADLKSPYPVSPVVNLAHELEDEDSPEGRTGNLSLGFPFHPITTLDGVSDNPGYRVGSLELPWDGNGQVKHLLEPGGGQQNNSWDDFNIDPTNPHSGGGGVMDEPSDGVALVQYDGAHTSDLINGGVVHQRTISLHLDALRVLFGVSKEDPFTYIAIYGDVMGKQETIKDVLTFIHNGQCISFYIENAPEEIRNGEIFKFLLDAVRADLMDALPESDSGYNIAGYNR